MASSSRDRTHRVRHVELLEGLDELLADFLAHHPKASLRALIIPELHQWAMREAARPTAAPCPHHHGGTRFDDESDTGTGGASST